jgi:hypothetical protein
VARVAARLAEFEAALKQRLRASPVLHHDETPARVAGDDRDRLLYIYTARAGKLVWFGAAAGRGHLQLDGFGILPGYRGTLVRDDYAAYAKYDQQLTAVQLCCAHYPDTAVMPIPGPSVLAGGGDRGLDIGIITGLRGTRGAGRGVCSGPGRWRVAWSGRGLAV